MHQNIKREKHNFDAVDQVAGRLASRVAFLLMGKHKTGYRPNVDAGDEVEITSVGRLKFSGKKIGSKLVSRHSGYPGGLKRFPLAKVFKENPGAVFKKMVYRMLPKNKLRPGMIKRLMIK